MLTIASASGNIFAFLWSADSEVIQTHSRISIGSEWAKKVCPKGHGLGLDGFFILDPPVLGRSWNIDHWDPDGSPSFCSNGTRVAVALLPEIFHGQLEVCSNNQSVLVNRRGLEVSMRLPQGADYKLDDPPAKLPYPAIYGWSGTPHLILQVPDIDSIDLRILAPPLRFHPELPQGANVSILQILKPGLAKIRTWEKGVEGETHSCGQAAAVAVAWMAEQSNILSWQIQPQGMDMLELNIKKIENRRWSELWLGGSVRILGELTPGLSLGLSHAK
ncbi:MAG: hypothetical protein FWG02_06635 [Holophagaceae bacterium]|nr:hypothetical protein [Holophagaceae bacterium]